LRQEHLGAHLPALAFDVDEVLALILVEVQAEEFRHPQARVQQHQEDGPVAHRRLILPRLQSQ
jgi:hypothetical protein